MSTAPAVAESTGRTAPTVAQVTVREAVFRVERAQDLDTALTRAFESSKPMLVEVIVENS